MHHHTSISMLNDIATCVSVCVGGALGGIICRREFQKSVLGIYERKREVLFLEILEKPESPNNVIIPNCRSFFLNGQTNIAMC